MRRLRARLLATALTAALVTSCSSDTGDTVSLRMTVWTTDKSQLAMFVGIADEYRASHPAVSASPARKWSRR